jgi:hypothetical protein
MTGLYRRFKWDGYSSYAEAEEVALSNGYNGYAVYLQNVNKWYLMEAAQRLRYNWNEYLCLPVPNRYLPACDLEWRNIYYGHY